MKKISFYLILILLIVGCVTPAQIVETYKTDSLGHTTKTVQKIYTTQSFGAIPGQTVRVIPQPIIYNYPYYFPTYVPRVVVPVHIGGYGGPRRH